jgi:hypothetical protein
MDRKKLASTVAVAGLAAGLWMAAPVKASAEDRPGCQRRVEKAQEHFRHEAREHGRHSRQAQNAKAKLNAEWDRCWTESRGWYDPHRHEWRTDRDWDRNYDWDRDRDDHDR